MRILIIEDSERLRRSLRTGLCALGHEVDVAADGESGLADISALRPPVLSLLPCASWRPTCPWTSPT